MLAIDKLFYITWMKQTYKILSFRDLSGFLGQFSSRREHAHLECLLNISANSILTDPLSGACSACHSPRPQTTLSADKQSVTQ